MYVDVLMYDNYFFFKTFAFTFWIFNIFNNYYLTCAGQQPSVQPDSSCQPTYGQDEPFQYNEICLHWLIYNGYKNKF